MRIYSLVCCQVAAQQGKYLASVMNKHSHLFTAPQGTANPTSAGAGAGAVDTGTIPPFKYAHMGSMAAVGEWKGVIDTPNICKLEIGNDVVVVGVNVRTVGDAASFICVVEVRCRGCVHLRHFCRSAALQLRLAHFIAYFLFSMIIYPPQLPSRKLPL